MEFAKGYTSSYYGYYVDTATWRDVERFEITGGSITREPQDLRESAQIERHDWTEERERYIRIYLDATQGSETAHLPLFTGLVTSPQQNIQGLRVKDRSAQCYSVLKPAQDVLLDRGWYAPVEIEGAALIKQLFADLPAPVVVAENSPSLEEAIIAEDNESRLSMADKILTAINWRLKLGGGGTIYVLPKATEPAAILSATLNDIIETEMEISRDWYGAPNVFRAVSNDLSAVARDDSEKSELSTVNRGREIWKEETNCALSAGESIADYAIRRLREEQKIQTSVSYNRRFLPDVVPSDLLTLHYPEIGLQGTYQITSQTIDLTYGGRTQEEVVDYERD